MSKNANDDSERESAEVARAGEYAQLVVPNSEDQPSQEFTDKWVKPFYGANLVSDFERFKTNFQCIAREIEDSLITDLLTQRNWRPRLSAAYFVAIQCRARHVQHIGKLLLRSDLCYAGRGYALALARINTQESVDFLTKYLDHYLRRPDLHFDQLDVLVAVRHCDRLNETTIIDSYRALWDEFIAERNESTSIEDATSWFCQRMKAIVELGKLAI